jgi:DNA-binding PadR family transcriptional regulator
MLYKDLRYGGRHGNVEHKKEMTKMGNIQKEVQAKLAKGLLDLIILQYLNSQPMHGYQIITKIRKSFGVYFGPSTIYPLLATLEKKGFVNSEWNERPRKVYKLTNDGHTMLNFTENSLNLLCHKIGANGTPKITIEAGSKMSRFPKKTNFMSALAK